MKIVWNDVEPSTVALGSAALLKSLSVLVETEQEEVCSEAANSAVDQGEAAEEEKVPETATADDEVAPDDSNRHASIDDNGDENSAQPDGIGASEQNMEKPEEEPEKMEQENESQPQSLVDVRSEPNDANATDSSEAKKKSLVKMKIPPIWTPCDRRTNAALIYLYFRSVSGEWSSRPMDRACHISSIFPISWTRLEFSRK